MKLNIENQTDIVSNSRNMNNSKEKRNFKKYLRKWLKIIKIKSIFKNYISIKSVSM